MQTSGSIRIVQVSDTHVSRKRAYFVDNWEVFLDEMARAPPDLIVHSGDVSFDGAADEDDIPGNHDTGESPAAVRLGQPVDSEPWPVGGAITVTRGGAGISGIGG